MPYSNGLPRNIKQCLEDFDIPLYLSHTVTKVFGRDRLRGIELSKVDENRNPIIGSEQYFDVDTLLLSVGLIPENHLADEAGILMDRSTKGPLVDETYMTSIEGIFACGNGLHVHDLVDFVSLQAERAAKGVAKYLEKGRDKGKRIEAVNGKNVSYTVPKYLHPQAADENVEIFFRITHPMDKAVLKVTSGDKVIRKLNKRKLMPSEMERVLLTAKEIRRLDDDVVISVEEVE